MIIKHNDITYSGVMGDVIEKLESLDDFEFEIWTDGGELPFSVDCDSDIEFLQESLKIIQGTETVWVLYGIIMAMKVIEK